MEVRTLWSTLSYYQWQNDPPIILLNQLEEFSFSIPDYLYRVTSLELKLHPSLNWPAIATEIHYPSLLPIRTALVGKLTVGVLPVLTIVQCLPFESRKKHTIPWTASDLESTNLCFSEHQICIYYEGSIHTQRFNFLFQKLSVSQRF